MKIIELYVKVFLLEDIDAENSIEKICKLVDQCLIKNEEYKKFHNSNKFKNYSFSSLSPIEKDKTYKAGNLYTFRLRVIDEGLCEYFMKELTNEYTQEMKVLIINKKLINQRHIVNVFNITPIIAKFDFGYWRGNVSIDVLEARLKENIIKKYNAYNNVKIDEDFELFTLITQKNRTPISTKYKDISLLGDKFCFEVADNQLAQDIVHFAIGTGLGELNARGFGFINYNWA